jgi:hypothetical protein
MLPCKKKILKNSLKKRGVFAIIFLKRSGGFGRRRDAFG